VNSEITKVSDIQWLQGWVLYDDTCASCRRFAQRLEGVLTRRGFDLAPLQSAWIADCLDEGLDLTEIRVITTSGESFGGADALIFLARRIWWAWPFCILGHVPGIKPLLRRAYRLYASHQHCQGESAHSQISSTKIAQKPAQL
jgi:predicted DCC family thiol-disulfide oxidoreductase YuxK